MQDFASTDTLETPTDEQDSVEGLSPSDKALVKQIQKRIRADKKHHESAFKRMRDDMHMARHGADEKWPKDHYRANLVGRHIKQKTAALYAKNPKAIARRRKTLDFAVWDEDPESLKMAFQAIQMGDQMMAMARQHAQPDPMTGEPQLAPIPQQTQDAFNQAMAVVQDYQQGLARRQQIDKIGKTLEILFQNAMTEQKPVDFKTGMKQLVRRTCTTGVGYVEIGFQRETGPRPGLTEQLADARQRLDHLKRLVEEVGEGEVDQDDPEIAELERSVAALQAEPEIVLREGLIFDFPQSTKVIPDRLTKNLTGFVGARWVTIEYAFTLDQIEELFGVDVENSYVPYQALGDYDGNAPSAIRIKPDEDDGSTIVLPNGKKGEALACVWKHYDKVSGLCYYVCDGYNGWLREPAPPDVYVEDFWPVYALTFNSVEDEDDKGLFPPSDARLMHDQQTEYNRSRQGMREHRDAARPRYVYQNGALEVEDIDALTKLRAFQSQGINLPQGAKISDVLQVMPVPGVDPNLYETGQLFTDIQMVVGTNESQFGGTAQATATESAIAANASKSADGASVDDLDAFLTVIARSASQILYREMSEEQVKKIVGPGAMWPQQSLLDIASELWLEVEAGSSGKPNQAIETANFERLAPLLVQIPGIRPEKLAGEAIKRLDDRLDINEFVASGIPAIVAQNRMNQAMPQNPANDPNAQGDQGGDNGPKPQQPGGSTAAFGSNQV